MWVLQNNVIKFLTAQDWTRPTDRAVPQRRTTGLDSTKKFVLWQSLVSIFKNQFQLNWSTGRRDQFLRCESNPLGTECFFLQKNNFFNQFIEPQSKYSHKILTIFEKTIFFVFYTKYQFASREFDIRSNLNFFCTTAGTYASVFSTWWERKMSNIKIAKKKKYWREKGHADERVRLRMIETSTFIFYLFSHI